MLVRVCVVQVTHWEKVFCLLLWHVTQAHDAGLRGDRVSAHYGTAFVPCRQELNFRECRVGAGSLRMPARAGSGWQFRRSPAAAGGVGPSGSVGFQGSASALLHCECSAARRPKLTLPQGDMGEVDEVDDSKDEAAASSQSSSQPSLQDVASDATPEDVMDTESCHVSIGHGSQ